MEGAEQRKQEERYREEISKGRQQAGLVQKVGLMSQLCPEHLMEFPVFLYCMCQVKH